MSVEDGPAKDLQERKRETLHGEPEVFDWPHPISQESVDEPVFFMLLLFQRLQFLIQ